MIRNNIIVKIEGSAATGKSTIMWSIIKSLMEHGIDVEMINTDYKDINHLQHAMEHDISLVQRLDAIKDKTKVVVQEVITTNK
jgi:uridine kinase